MSLPALSAFTDCSSTIDDAICATIAEPLGPERGRGDGLATILVTGDAAPRRTDTRRTARAVREQGRTANSGPDAKLPMHTGGHNAYAGLAGGDDPIVVVRATLLGWQRNERGDVLAAPRAWKNDFR